MQTQSADAQYVTKMSSMIESEDVTTQSTRDEQMQNEVEPKENWRDKNRVTELQANWASRQGQETWVR